MHCQSNYNDPPVADWLAVCQPSKRLKLRNKNLSKRHHNFESQSEKQAIVKPIAGVQNC